MSRLPIYRDDLSFQDRNRSSFDDMRRRMESDMRSPFHNTWDDEFERMCGDFYQLKPSSTDPLSRLKRSSDYGSRELLDESGVKSVIVEDPGTKSRRFEMSFDVKEYNPEDISVKVIDDTLVVEAKHEVEREGAKTSNQFNRKIQIPKEVDSSRLKSTLSKDGILTVVAPVPPQYLAVTSPAKHTIEATGAQAGRDSPLQSATHEPKYVSSVYTTPARSSDYPEPLLGQRASPLLQAPVSPRYTQHVTIAPQSHDHSVPSPPQYEQCVTPTSPIQVLKSRPKPPLEEPTFYNTDRGCELVLLVDIGKPYLPEDIKVKVDGLCISIEAEHLEKSGAKTSKCSVSRDFDIKENIDSDTVTANLKAGILEINAIVKK